MLRKKVLKLGEVLFEEGLIENIQLSEALEIQKKDNRKLGELLIEKGWIDDHKLTEILARIFQLPYIQLSQTTIEEAILGMIPYELLLMYKVVPIAIRGHHLTVATNDPLNVSALQEIQYKSGYLINPVMASSRDIDLYLKQSSLSLQKIQKTQELNNYTTGNFDVVDLVDRLIKEAVREKASDIHFEPQSANMRVRFRIDGVLYEKSTIPKALERNVISRIKIISGMDVADNRRPQDGRTSLTYDDIEYDIRISTLPNILGENLDLRILDKKFVNRSFVGLGMDKNEVSMMNRLLANPYGLILVTGPTGAGKTTTLYTMLNTLNQISKNIISVEDPVEYEMPGINQTAINILSGYTFAKAIRHILRHDPDIIMVGEIRDVETAEIAIRAALTGHLVLSTIHTNSAAGAITRLLEMNIEPYLISSSVNGVISQRLVRKLCPACREEYKPRRQVLRDIKKFLPIKDSLRLVGAKGCEQCFHTGYKGRDGIFEILSVDEDIRTMILSSAREKEIEQQALSKGMKLLRVAGMQKVVSKITSMKEMMRMIFIT